ncbi:MAG TPA: cation:proton antiporter [Verrucomicrobiae bacterium]|nr:cation:proton antiporter [Verrucomicrobiae bacterium]
MPRSLLTYLLALVAGAAAIGLLVTWGAALHPGGAVPVPRVEPASSLMAHLQSPLPLLLIQIVVILAAARLAGAAIKQFGQPAVIGEIVAGILLGPSLLGWLAPDMTAFLFPPASLPALTLFGQVGVLLFMFVVGLEVDLERQAAEARAAIAVSHAGLIIPFILGVLCAMVGFEELAPPGVPFTGFALFLGIAMSVTAFPVLARILKERKLTETPLGQRAIACAAIGDVLAWSILAVVVAIVKAGDVTEAAWMIGLALVFAIFMVGVVRKPLERLVDRYYIPGGREGYPLIAGMLIFAFASAVFTEIIGIHALFGAFLAGTLVSGHHEFRKYLHDRVLPLSSLIMLPLFFALVGLRTKVGLLDSALDWLVCAGLIAVASAGKLGGCMLAARWTGAPWRDAFALGALLNTRGLMELIVLNVGYELGILSARVFTMLVIMAIVTTVMTGPLLTLALKKKK